MLYFFYRDLSVITINIIRLMIFSHKSYLMVFRWSDSKSRQFFWTLPNNTVVWLLPIRLLISYFSSPLSKRVNYYCNYHHLHVLQFSSHSGKVYVLVSLFPFFDFHSVPLGRQVLFFFFYIHLIWFSG